VGGLGFLLALLILGVAVPAAVIATVDNRDSIPQADVSDLTPFEKRGVTFSAAPRSARTATRWRRPNGRHGGAEPGSAPPAYNLVLDAIHNGRAPATARWPRTSSRERTRRLWRRSWQRPSTSRPGEHRQQAALTGARECIGVSRRRPTSLLCPPAKDFLANSGTFSVRAASHNSRECRCFLQLLRCCPHPLNSG
jgi:hypothetical protein